ncbi:uncharacterized protein LOC124692285 isoform X1 [Lolium rigidum]|uniref:uncharacterized protein LOC124692285 isoform X1 n=1 Tax=Lolium rigidum TaxID=89674 RepID=UPI001F5DA0A8|nr:uncharacterized protein LOC124692285 isoform X1 [Lolium rigidum]
MRQLPCDKRGGGLAAADSGRARFGLVDDDDDDDQINEQQCLDEIQIRTIKRPDAAAATPAPFAHSAMRSQISGEIMVAARPTHQPHQAEASVVSVVKMEPKWPSSHPPSSRNYGEKLVGMSLNRTMCYCNWMRIASMFTGRKQNRLERKRNYGNKSVRMNLNMTVCYCNWRRISSVFTGRKPNRLERKRL